MTEMRVMGDRRRRDERDEKDTDRQRETEICERREISDMPGEDEKNVRDES